MSDDERRPTRRDASPAPSHIVAGGGDADVADAVKHVREDLRALRGYSTGEQASGFVKLNTNECAYPPSPRVWQALAEFVGLGESGGGGAGQSWADRASGDLSGSGGSRLRLYPDPLSRQLCDVVARVYGVNREQILAGNGSDDCLTVVYRTFLAPGDRAACAWPSYGLYDTLAAIQGSAITHVDYPTDADGRVRDWHLPAGLATTGARLTLVANPNNPSSTLDSVATLRALADQLDGVLVVDEAYVDFALAVNPDASMLPHLNAHPNLIVLRTFSKSYSLAGARLGLMFAAAPLIALMNKVKDSYNVNAMTQAVGTAALEDGAHHAALIERTVSEKARLEAQLATLGWSWPAAFGNFLLCHVGPDARRICEAVRARKILLRFWDTPQLRESLRITVGSREQNDALVAALRAVV